MEQGKFRRGDKVRVENNGKVYPTYGTWKGLRGIKHNWEMGNRCEDGDVGVVVTTAPHSGQGTISLCLVRLDGGKDVIIEGNGLTKIGRSKLKMEQPKFVLQYELDSDPFEVFTTEKELRKRIGELAEKRDLKRDSIKVYDIKRVRAVELGVKITIK